VFNTIALNDHLTQIYFKQCFKPKVGKKLHVKSLKQS